MRAQKDKLYKTLKYYKEAIGEQPSGELHPDLAGEQEEYEDENERAQAMEVAENFFNSLYEQITQVVSDEVKKYLDTASGIEAGALEILLDDQSPGGTGNPSISEAGLSDLIYKAMNWDLDHE